MKEPIRILCLFTVLNRGGAETMCMNLYRHIDRTKVQFDFLVYHEERGIYEDEIESLGGHVYRIPHIKYFAGHIKGAREFFKKHREHTAVHNHMQSNGCFICREAKRSGVRTIIYHSHSGPLPVLGSGLKTAIRRVRNKLLNRISLASSTDFFACGEEAAVAIPKGHEAHIIRNAINLNQFGFAPSVRIKLREQLNCNDKLIIGNVARFDCNKNHSFTVEVFKHLIERQPNAELWLVGDGILKPQIEQQVKDLNIEDKVRFFGVRTDVDQLLQAMDVFLFPSIAEGLPVSCIEAQASGIQCVFSDGFDPHTVITDNCTILSLGQKPEEWAEQILKLDIGNRTDQSKAVRRAGYDIRETAKYMEEYYLSKV